MRGFFAGLLLAQTLADDSPADLHPVTTSNPSADIVAVATLEPSFEKELLQLAGCENPERKVQNQITFIYAVRSLYMLKEATLQLNLVLQSRMEQYSDTKHLDELVKAHGLIQQLSAAIHDRVAAMDEAKKHSVQLDSDLDGALVLVEQCIRGEAIIEDGPKKDKFTSKCKSKLLAAIAALEKSSVSVKQFPEVPVAEIQEAFERMGKMLSLHQGMDEDCEREWAKTKTLKEGYLSSLSAAQTALATAELQQASTEESIQIEEKRFKEAEAVLRHIVDGAKKLVGKVGLWRMSGSPCNEKTTRIAKLWDENRFDLLISEWGEKPDITECSSLLPFHFWRDPNPTQPQKDAQQQWSKAEADLKTEIDGHQKTKNDLNIQLQQHQATWQQEERKVAEAEANIKRLAESEAKDGQCWIQWARDNPVQYANLKAMEEMRIMMNYNAKWMLNGHEGDSQILKAKDTIEDWVDIDMFEEAERNLKELKQVLNSPDKSAIGFLRNVPELDLKRAMMPAIAWSKVKDPSFLLAPRKDTKPADKQQSMIDPPAEFCEIV